MEFYCCIFVLLFVYLKCRVESAHWALKRVLQNSLGDLCNVWDAMNNMMMLQHTETSTHVVGHVFKKNLIQEASWNDFKVCFKLDCC